MVWWLLLASLRLGSWPWSLLGRHRRRRPGLQAQDFHNRKRDEERYWLFRKVRWSQELVHDKVEDRCRKHKDLHRHKVFKQVKRSIEIIPVFSDQDSEA